MLSDMTVQTDRHISANRPDIIIKDKMNSTCKLIDTTVPCDKNVSSKEIEDTKDVENDNRGNTHCDRSTWYHQKRNGQ